jgi:hypothetical protein
MVTPLKGDDGVCEGTGRGWLDAGDGWIGRAGWRIIRAGEV